MKLGISLAAATLALVGATAAQAQLTITLNAPTTLSNGALAYGGTITNPTSSAITVNAANLGSPTGMTNGVQFFNALGGQFSDPAANTLGLSNLPLTIAGAPAGGAPGFYSDNDLFELVVPANIPLTSLVYTLSDSTGRIDGTATFTVGGTAVPEPGSIALLASGLVGGSLFVARRRK